MVKNLEIKAFVLLLLASGAFSVYGQFDPYKTAEALASLLKQHYTCSLFTDEPTVFAKIIDNSRQPLNPSVIADLLSCGANANAFPAVIDNPRKLTPLMALLFNHGSDPEIVESIKSLLAHGAEVNARSLYGETPLYFALKYSTPEVINILLEAGADADAQLSYDLSTPLHALLNRNSFEEKPTLIKALIAHGANPKLADNEGTTPLHLAVKSKSKSEQLAVVRELVKAGANLNAQNNFGETPLTFAAYYNADPNVVRFMRINGADKTIKNKFGKTVIDFLQAELNNPQYKELPHYADNVREIINAIN